jgi:hypothetical protein
MRTRGLLLGLLAAAMLSAGPTHAAAPANPCTDGPVTQPLVANANRLGFIDLHFFFALGAPVDFFECVAGRPEPLGRRVSNDTLTSMVPGTTWRCVRLARYFAAVSTLPDGTIGRGLGSIRTRSCSKRFELTVPRSVKPGRIAKVRVRDRWNIGGVRAQLCVTRPGKRAACRQIAFTDGKVRTREFRMDKRGRWHVQLRAPVFGPRLEIAVGVPSLSREPPPPTLLATGDSTMNGVDSFLVDELGGVDTVETDVRPGIAISKSDEWQPIAVAQVKRLKPATTVVSIGANEGWPMAGADGALHECCDEQWIDEYARRVRRTMQTYGKRVLWLTIVAPKEERRVPNFTAVNTAILRAAQGLPEVHVVRMDQLFTPDGYRDVISYEGRDVRVREADGIHLNVAGTRIAAREIVKVLKALSGG